MMIGGARSGDALTDSEMLMVDEERPHKVPSKVAEIKKVIIQTLGKG